MKTFWKKIISKFFALIFKEKKISNANFSKFLFQYPQNFILEWFLTPKKKFTWRLDNPYFIIDKIVSVRKCFGHFVTPLSLIRVKLVYFNFSALFREKLKETNTRIPFFVPLEVGKEKVYKVWGKKVYAYFLYSPWRCVLPTFCPVKLRYKFWAHFWQYWCAIRHILTGFWRKLAKIRVI